jgi:excisionase family DNA binding protein
MPMTKEQAAEFLGVSVRAVQRYAAQGKLSVSYTRGERGQIAQYDEKELDGLKEQLTQPVYPQRGVVESGSHDKPGSRAIMPVMPSSLVLSSPADPRVVMEAYRRFVPIADKLTLSLADASALAGLSRDLLRTAIKSGRLKAAKRGRGWNIKRDDLDSYIKKL